MGFCSRGGGELRFREGSGSGTQHHCITELSTALQSLGQGLGRGEVGTASPEGPLAPSGFL